MNAVKGERTKRGKKREKMNRQERAKQFMPFSALKGLEEELLRAETAAEAEANGAGGTDSSCSRVEVTGLYPCSSAGERPYIDLEDAVEEDEF